MLVKGAPGDIFWTIVFSENVSQNILLQIQ